ncbi:hemagglutinin repeat-containing protein [Pseudomonas sp. NFACC39-1]|uniref:hemagglutinin repeat-containing protein n=1 Tax=Pseudomonas sp. NFACC39-1 TaxID=1566195 RepID=UPI0008C3BE78|nr:hemagglutinin repeat-containing protein [Pseudomonas sp. NFACC39-1]SEN62644.1 filamentous hemagglutinin [Pseudomonas sp. NFACC39-1]
MDDRQHAFLARQPSAALQTREHFWGMPKRGLAFLLANVMFWQPLWAQAEGIVVSAPGTGLDRAGNGVPIVNIAKPNANGLSHNQFKDYNVGSNGVILNNATARTQSTQLGGIIVGNPNLNGAAAKTILNEVNGGNPSQLRGYTEVAGQSAHVIVANPYGITCNGCGFINSPKVTLSTGKPVVENGRLDRYQVDKGSVAIEGAGLNANNVDHFEIITRSAKINAEIQAKNLTIVAGRNDVNATTLNATARADDGSVKPQLAIDSSALGGMYAGAIKLVGTEAGVGVKLAGELAASGGDIQIDANGHLSVVSATASNAIGIKAKSLDAQGPLYAGTQLTAQTTQELINRQSLAARGAVQLSSGGTLTNTGVIEAGVNPDNSRNTTGDLTINGQTLNNSGKLLASRSLTVDTKDLLDNQNGIIQAQNVILTTARLINQGDAARLLGEASLVINAPAVLNLSGLIRFADGQAASLTVDSLDNRQGRIEVAGGNLSLNARVLKNAGGKLIAGRLDIDAGQLDNSKGLIAASQTSAKVVARQRLDNGQGKIQAQTLLTLSGGELLNQGGTLVADEIQLNASRLDNSSGGVISAEDGALELTLDKDLDNHAGKVQASTVLTVAAQSINNHSASLTGQTLELTSRGKLDNTQGTISSDDSVLDTEDLDNTQGLIQGLHTLKLVGRNLNNTEGDLLGGAVEGTFKNITANTKGTVSAETGQLTLMVSQHLNNALGRLQASQGDADIQVASLDNREGVVAAGQLLLVAEDGHINNRGGRIISDRLDLQAASLDNSEAGLIAAGADGALLILKQTAPGQSWLLNNKGRIQSDAGLQIESNAVDNRGGAMLGRSIGITTRQLNNSDKGGIVSNGGAITLNVAGVLENMTGVIDAGAQRLLLQQLVELDNRGGTLRGQRLDISSTSVDNRAQGQIIAGSDGLKIVSKALQNQQGVILANGSHTELVLEQGRLQNQGGTLQADSLEITSEDLDNSAANGKAGLISSLLGDLQLTVTRLVNRAGKLFAKGEVAFDGSSLDNTGGEISGTRLDVEAVSQVVNIGGLIESANGLKFIGGQLNNSAGGQVRALGGASSQIKLTGNLNNQNGVIEIGSQDLSLAGVQLNNLSGNVRHAAQGLFDLDLSNLAGSSGSLTGLGSGAWEIGSVSGVGTWQLNGGLTYTSAQGLTLKAGERIASASALSLNVASLTNAGALLSNGNLSLTLGGNLINSGLLSAGQKLTVNANNLLQRDGRLVSGGDSELNLRGTLDNLGRLIANRHLAVTASRIDNKGTLGAQGNLKFNAVNGINNGADTLLFSGGSMELHGSSLSNYYGDIYSQGNLTFSAVGGGRAASLSNLSGTIEAQGDIDINALMVENAKAEFEITSGQTSGSLSWVCGQHCSGGNGWKRGLITIITSFNDTVLKDSPAARLVAGKDLTIRANEVQNRYSLMAANDNLDVTAVNLLNQGAASRSGRREVNVGTPSRIDNSLWDQMEFVDVPAFNAQTAAGHFDETRFQELIDRSSDERFSLMSDVTTWNENGNNVYAAVLQAGKTVKLNVTHNIQNGTLHENTLGQLTGSLASDQTASVGGININLGKRSTDASAQAPKDVTRIERVDADGVKQVSFVAVDFRGVPFTAVDPTASSSFRLPKGSYGLFVQSQNPQSRYLIETNPELTQVGQFMSSDYLLGKLNFSADDTARRLGDGRYESRLISDAVLAQTGQRFLAGGLNDDYEQFRYLMDNALTSKKELNLAVGVTLTSEQVAALTHDIVWMEERIVDGQKVLVPVLYLAQAESRNVRGGSLIQGRDLELIAGNDLINVGTLRAKNDLSAAANGSLYQGGLAEANERLSLMATDSIRNALAGEIRGNQVSLSTLKGDIVNDRTAIAVREASGMRTLVDDGGHISARDTLTIKSGRDLTNSSAINSGGDANLSATRDLNLLATRNESEIHKSTDGGHRYTITTTVENLASSVTSGANLTLKAGRDINVIASTAKADNDLTANAAGNLTLASAGDEHNVETRIKDGKKRIREEDNHTVQKAAEFSAGGNVALSAGKDLGLIASRVSAGDEAYLFAGDNVNLQTADNVDYSYYSKIKTGSLGKKKSTMTEAESVLSVGSSIEAGKKLVVSAGQDFNATGAKLNSDGTLLVTAGRDINLNAGEDYASQANASSKKGWASSKSSASEITQTRLNSTELVAKNIELKADNDISLTAAALRAEETIKLTAGNDVLIGAGEETQTTAQSKSTGKTSATFSGLLTSTQKSQQGQTTSTQSIGSDISGGSIQIKSGRDTIVEGSTLVADNNIGIDAGRNLEITSAENTETSNSRSGSKKIGEIGSWWQGATGIVKQKETEQFTSTRQSGSQIASLGGNISLNAGDHYTQTASQLVTPQGDVSITAKHVDIEAGFDTLNSTKTASTSRTAVGGSVSIPLLDALKGIQQMGEAAQKTSDDRMVALAAVNAAMSANQALEAGQALMKDPTTGIKISASLSDSRSHSESRQSGRNVVGSDVVAGGNIKIVATGDGSGSDINVVGSRIEGGGEVSLKADGEINLLSAQNTAHQQSTNGNSGWSAGIGFSFGGSQNGFSLDLAANAGRGSADGDDVTQTNTHIKGGNSVRLESGGDTNIKGGVVSAEQVKVKVGGDLNIESLQDTSTYTSKQQSANVGVSICVPPFCYGTSSVSGGIASQNMHSEYASVSEQSGIKAGNGGFQVEVTGNTDLKGAVIASTDKAVAEGKNTLSTGTLTSSDIKNKAEYDATSINLSGGFGGDMGRDGNGNTSATANPNGPKVPNKSGVSVSTPVVLYAGGSSSSKTYSGISGAAVTITDTVKQQELTGQTAEQAVAAINTDVSSDRDGSNKLKPIFDAQEIGVDFEIVGKFVQNVSQYIESRAREIDQKKDQATKEKAAADNEKLPIAERIAHHENYLLLNQQIKEIGDNWGAGGIYRQVATALVAGISGNVAGSSAQFAQNMVVNYVQQQGSAYIGELVKKGLKEGSPEHAALHAILGCAGAAASNQSCSAGALGGAAASVIAGLFADSSPNETAVEREAKRNIITSLVTGIAAMSNPNGVATANNAATANVDNNWLATQQYVQAKKEIDAEPNLLKKLAIAGKWKVTSLRQDLLTGSGVLKGFTDGMAGAGLGTLDSAVTFLTDPMQSWEAVKEFASSEEARALLGDTVAAAFKSQIDQIGKAVVEGGDANAENLGNQMGQAMALVIQLMIGGGSSSANSALTLSRMGIDVSVNTVKKIGASVDIDVLKTRISKLEKLAPDSDVPVIDPPKPVVSVDPKPNPVPDFQLDPKPELSPRVDISDEFKVITQKDGTRTYRYLDPADGNHGLEISVVNGVLGFEIRAQGDASALGSGRDMFISAMKRLENDGVEVNSIRGYWEKGTDSVNYKQYMDASGLIGKENAALNTWTGKIAQDYGFTKVVKLEEKFGDIVVVFGR